MRHTLTPNDPRYNEQWHYFEADRRHQRARGVGQIHGHRRGGRGDRHGLSPACRSRRQHPAGLRLHLATPSSSNDGNGRDTDASDPGDWINAGECGPGDPAAFEASSWHGTHVAGTIAARTNNSLGVAGIAFNAKDRPGARARQVRRLHLGHRRRHRLDVGRQRVRVCRRTPTRPR